MADNGYGYDPVTGLNSGNLDFQSLQGTLGGQNYYAPVSYDPSANGGPDQSGYIDFGSAYNPTTNSGDYFYYGNYGEALGASDPGGKSISYGSAAENSLVGTPGNGDPLINGVDYIQGASYASLAAQGIGTPSYSVGIPENPGTSSSVTPYTQYTEPGYIGPTASQAGSTGTQSYAADGSALGQGQSNPATFMFGDNGSAGTLAGTFSNTTPGQSTAFYANEPGSLSQGNISPTLGQFQPYNPALQALNASRSLN